MGGLALALPLLAPAAAQAQLGPSPATLFYTVQQNSPVPPPADGQNWWVKAVLTEVAGGVQFDFESNFSQVGNFANDFVFSLNKALTSISVSCTPGTGTACLDQKPGGTQADLFEYDPSGQGNFVGSKGWEFALLTPPPNGNLPVPPAFPPLSGNGDTISFTVLATVQGTTGPRGLNLSDFNQSGTSYSCTHMQGITGSTNGTPNANSSRLCTGEPDLVPTPGPLPLLGAAAAFGYSRRIRTRIKSARQQAAIS